MAGGSGTRMRIPGKNGGNGGNKVYLPLAGRPALAMALATLASSPRVAAIVLVVRAGDENAAARVVDAAGGGKVVAVVPGGVTRHDSEQAGLAAVGAQRSAGATFRHVAIHDGARPFLTHRLLDALIDAAQATGGAIPVLPFTEPMAAVDGHGRPALMPTHDLVRVQTPQVFATDELLDAYAAARVDGFDGVDTAQVVERYSSLAVAAVPGDPRNIKVTTAADLPVAEALAARFVDGRWVDPASAGTS